MKLRCIFGFHKWRRWAEVSNGSEVYIYRQCKRCKCIERFNRDEKDPWIRVIGKKK